MSSNSDIESLFDQVQESALPAVWSKGVALSREKGLVAAKNEPDEIIIKIQKPQTAVAPKVTLWLKDGDWFCDCGDRNDPCVHVVAAIAAVKNKTLDAKKPAAKAKKNGATAAKKDVPPPNLPPELQYRFFARSGYLYFERLLVHGTKKPVKLNQSLVSYMGGVGSGRIKDAPPPATKEDYAIDHILGGQIQNPLDRYTLTRLLSTLKGVSNVRFDEEPIEISMQTASMQAILRDDGKDFRLELAADPTVSQAFKNGVVLSSGQLKALREPLLNPKEKSYFRKINAGEIQSFVAEVLPNLEAKMVIQVKTIRLPQLRKIEPHVVLHMMAEGKNRLSVFASIIYGDPPVAELRNGILEPLSDTEVPQRDLEAENRLSRRLHQELQLQLERQAVFENESALLFASKARGWERTGNGYEMFSVKGTLSADISFDDDNVSIGFNGAFTNGKAVAAKKVLEAWRHNKAFVQLNNGGWAEIPHDFLMKHGERVEALLKAKERFGEKTPKYLIPEAADLCIEAGGKLPERLTSLKAALLQHEGIPSAKLPKDLKADLRSYQKRGVDWLKFLKNLNLGGLLADDMGLGKTLQSIACIEGSVLVICPTSVIQAWSEQITQFRPGLKYTIYHGSGRSLEADVVLTTYGVFRLEQNLLSQKHWDMIVLDEAQTIKNPDSQIARAIHRLQGDFKVALSGTPVENRIDDLWSQFEFLNPGLLGTRQEFLDSFQQVMRSGDPTGLENIRRKIRPFILRRMKKEVAPELPPRTEIVLHSELNQEEQNLYKAVMAASQKEVLEKLEAGNVMAALEMLLRLRQTCCHRGLVPGSDAPKTELSSKLTLLFETLEESLDQGHRALVFSQWTSLLDIVEPFLKERAITYSRLDGSTRNRDKVVSEFQKDDGPSVMLISLKAGGVGITLTAADHIYILDPWWNPAVEDQAADRAHRIGQENPVLIHRLVAKGTVEDKILALQKKKQAIAGALLNGNADPTTISRDEIMDLLR